MKIKVLAWYSSEQTKFTLICASKKSLLNFTSFPLFLNHFDLQLYNMLLNKLQLITIYYFDKHSHLKNRLSSDASLKHKYLNKKNIGSFVKEYYKVTYCLRLSYSLCRISLYISISSSSSLFLINAFSYSALNISKAYHLANVVIILFIIILC